MKLAVHFLPIVFATLVGALTLPLPLYSQVASARDQFRAFYQPKLPHLKASYGYVRFESALVKEDSESSNVEISSGNIQLSNFIFDRFPTISFGLPDVTAAQVSEKIDRQNPPLHSGGWIDDYAFEVQYNGQAKSLKITPNEYDLESVFDPSLIAPLCSVSLRRTYESIMNDSDFKILDFCERFSQNGRKIKSLFFSPHDQPTIIFEANFDPDTGVCIASLEPQPEQPEQTIQFKTTYAKTDSSPASEFLPPPVKITRSFGTQATTLILKYQRLTPAQQPTLSVTRYGFDETDVSGAPQSYGKVAVYTLPILLVACLVLFFAFVFCCLLTLLIGWISRRRGQQSLASETGDNVETPSRSDLSEP